MLIDRLIPKSSSILAKIGTDAPLIEAAKILGAGKDIVVVCDPIGVLAGVITKTDVVRQISCCQGASCVTPASMVMTRNVVVCRPGEWLNNIWATMKKRGLKNIPITDSESRPLGILNARDALQVLLEEVESEETLLRDYVMSVGYH